MGDPAPKPARAVYVPPHLRNKAAAAEGGEAPPPAAARHSHGGHSHGGHGHPHASHAGSSHGNAHGNSHRSQQGGGAGSLEQRMGGLALGGSPPKREAGWSEVPSHHGSPGPHGAPSQRDGPSPREGSGWGSGRDAHARDAAIGHHAPHPNMSVQQLLTLPCGKRCIEWMYSERDPKPAGDGAPQDARAAPTHCPHHRYLEHPDTLLMAQKYDAASRKMDGPGHSVFYEWLLTRRYLAERNPHIQAMFSRRSAGLQKSDVHGRTDSISANVAPLFDRFIRYAADIDAGLGYVELARKQAERNGDFTFIDIGFAPGGMSALLTDAHPGVRGVGFSLEPEKGGNVFPEKLGAGRFNPVLGDVVALARDDAKVDLSSSLVPGGPGDNFPGFDLLIAGITTSGSDQAGSMDMDEVDLKDLLHFSQLYVAAKNLRTDGQGSLMMRMHLGLRVVELHILAFVLENFSSHEIVPAGFPNVRGHKPVTEFAMRKTFWVLAKGFDPKPDCAARLRALLHADPKNILYSPFRDAEVAEKDAVSLFPGVPASALLEAHGDRAARILHPQWAAQLGSLRHLMASRDHADKLCGRCRGHLARGEGDYRWCHRCERGMQVEVLDAVQKVDGVVRKWRAGNPGVVGLGH
ncbi:hypothetical protein DFJ74DRAFT_712176 [Hyaloraphidium curvatum]|nr:hypothetical protein DFJ74DRAFT_712176 [Hyaloraphidium curvatum]